MNPRDLDSILDRTLDAIRDDVLSPEIEGAASQRVWAELEREIAASSARTEDRHSIRDCADFQKLVPAYLRGELTDARRMLFQDHVTECVACRRALRDARDQRSQRKTAPAAAPSSAVGRWAWRLAAAAVILLAFVGLSFRTDLLTVEAGGLIRIESVDGEAFRVLDALTSQVQAGDQVSFEDAKALRTGKDSRAMMRLPDGSLVEVGERAELAVMNRRPFWRIWQTSGGDSVIDLKRGALIVEAADQGSGHLYVDTPDAEVAVTGTVFAVNHGVKGSRVTVLEGEVHVDHAREEDVLHAGDQTTTRKTLERVPIEDEIAWSAKVDQHMALVRELRRVGREIDREIAGPTRRFDTALLDRMPAGTAIYVGIPNISEALGQAYDRMQSKITSNALLAQWWQESVERSGADESIADAIDGIRSYGRTIGDEVAVAIGSTPDGSREPRVLIAARVVDGESLRALVDRDLAGEIGTSIVRVDDPAGATAALEADLYLWIGHQFLAISPRLESIREFAGILNAGGASPFYGTSFHTRLADMYAKGVEWIAAADVATLRNDGIEPSRSDEERTLEAAGILDLEHVIGEHKEFGGTSENRAVLIFDQPRRGVASWLAEPGPIGALDFVSPNAYMAAGFLMKEPVQVVDEMIGFFGEGALDGLTELEREHSIDVREDIAAAIGGEFAFALDGPVLPKPSWKVVVEVYDPARLQATIERIVARGDEALREAGKAGLRLEPQEREGRTFYEIRSLDAGISAHYVFVDGYLVASASRALLDRALAFRASGVTLATSPNFQALLPRDGQAHFSAVLFQNFGAMLEPLGDALKQRGPGRTGRPAEGPGELLGQLGLFTEPSLTVAYGEPSRIVLANTSEGGLIGRGLTSILSVPSLVNVQQLLGDAVDEGRSGDAPGSAG